MIPDPPFALLAELTHRCPLQCPYCSNPLDLERAAKEMTTEEWCGAIRQAEPVLPFGWREEPEGRCGGSNH